MLSHLLRSLFLACSLAVSAFAQAPLQKLENLRLVVGQAGDADSFHVTDGVTNYHLRLYLVDAPETTAGDATLARRVREQTRYFGLPSPADTLRFGNHASARTSELLAQPFTAHTAGARGLGRSSEPRIYAYVTTADGVDLGEFLVREGLARAFGVGRVNATGVSQAEQRSHLADLELAAALARRGIWAESDAEKIAATRAEEREDTAELAAVSAAASGVAASADGATLDLNNSSLAQLDTLPGIGPALAQRIINARPFTSVEDLQRVSGIGPVLYQRLSPLVSVPSAPSEGASTETE